MKANLTDILARLDADAPAAEARLIEWLRIPSISAQPAHAGDCLRAAEWVDTAPPAGPLDYRLRSLSASGIRSPAVVLRR